jgi:hypothetical protein
MPACRECGADVALDENFCGGCGARVKVEEPLGTPVDPDLSKSLGVGGSTLVPIEENSIPFPPAMSLKVLRLAPLHAPAMTLSRRARAVNPKRSPAEKFSTTDTRSFVALVAAAWGQFIWRRIVIWATRHAPSKK